jgi:8-oxo-dGTP pyrophosphatase MutT (NUDIX family)
MGRYIVGMDSPHKDPGGWSVPGGKPNPGESPEQTAARELEEETGIVALKMVKLLQMPCVGDVTYDCHTYLATEWTGELRASTEGTPHWIRYRDLSVGKYASYNAHIIRALELRYMDHPIVDPFPTMPIVTVAGNKNSGKDSTAAMLIEQGFVGISYADELKRIANRIFGFGINAMFGDSSLREVIDPRGKDPLYWEQVFKRAKDAETAIVSPFRFTGIDPAAIRSGLYDQLDWLCARGERFTPRLALQRFGDEWGRGQDPMVWIDEARRGIAKIEIGYRYQRPFGFSKTPTPEAKRPAGAVISDGRYVNDALAVKSWGGRVFWIDASKRNGPPDLSHASEPRFADFESVVDGVIDNNGTPEQLRAQVDSKIVRNLR